MAWESWSMTGLVLFEGCGVEGGRYMNRRPDAGFHSERR
jgi:hypothetical protein